MFQLRRLDDFVSYDYIYVLNRWCSEHNVHEMKWTLVWHDQMTEISVKKIDGYLTNQKKQTSE